MATAGAYPEELPPTFNSQHWQTISDSKGNSYHQISVSLHTKNQEDWGYFQVGRSLQDFNDYLSTVKLVLKLGLPTALILVGFSSWWLAGLSNETDLFFLPTNPTVYSGCCARIADAFSGIPSNSRISAFDV